MNVFRRSLYLALGLIAVPTHAPGSAPQGAAGHSVTRVVRHPETVAPSLSCFQLLADAGSYLTPTHTREAAELVAAILDVSEPIHVLWAVEAAQCDTGCLSNANRLPMGVTPALSRQFAQLLEAIELMGPVEPGELERLAKAIRANPRAAAMFRKALLAYTGDGLLAGIENMQNPEGTLGPVETFPELLAAAQQSSIADAGRNTKFFLPVGFHSDDSQFYLGAIAGAAGPLLPGPRGSVNAAMINWVGLQQQGLWRNPSSRTRAFFNGDAPEAYRGNALTLGDALRLMPFVDWTGRQTTKEQREELLTALAENFRWTDAQKKQAQWLLETVEALNQPVKANGNRPTVAIPRDFPKGQLRDFLVRVLALKKATNFTDYLAALKDLRKMEAPDADTTAFLLPFFLREAPDVWSDVDPRFLHARREVTALLLLRMAQQVDPAFATGRRVDAARTAWELVEQTLTKQTEELRRTPDRTRIGPEVQSLYPAP